MIRLGFLILTIILSFEAFSGEAYFRPLSRQKIELTEGDSFKGVLELWNIKNISPQMIAALKGSTFLGNFYVVSLNPPRWSKDNPEVVLIEGLFILQNSIKKDEKTWEHGGLKINVKIKEINSMSFRKKSKGFMILDGEYKISSKDYKIYIIPGILFVTLIVFVLFLRSRKRKAPKVNTAREKDWKEIFEKAKTREDFSYLYEKKKDWTKNLGENKALYEAFLKRSEEYLFKEKIEDFELEELKVLSEPIQKEVGR